jgi:methyltransferase
MVIPTAYLGFLGIIGLERLNELRLSRRNARRALSLGAREAGRGHYPWMVALHSGLLAASAAEAVFLHRRFSPKLGILSLTGCALGQALRYWAVRTLAERWTTRVIVSDLTPVTRGPYRWLRHPNYLAVILETACIPLVGSCVITAATFSIANAFLIAQRIAIEEEALGPEWQRQFQHIPRLVPGLHR